MSFSAQGFHDHTPGFHAQHMGYDQHAEGYHGPYMSYQPHQAPPVGYHHHQPHQPPPMDQEPPVDLARFDTRLTTIEEGQQEIHNTLRQHAQWYEHTA
jgi:hypothetical protein